MNRMEEMEQRKDQLKGEQLEPVITDHLNQPITRSSSSSSSSSLSSSSRCMICQTGIPSPAIHVVCILLLVLGGVLSLYYNPICILLTG